MITVTTATGQNVDVHFLTTHALEDVLVKDEETEGIIGIRLGEGDWLTFTEQLGEKGELITVSVGGYNREEKEFVDVDPKPLVSLEVYDRGYYVDASLVESFPVIDLVKYGLTNKKGQRFPFMSLSSNAIEIGVGRNKGNQVNFPNMGIVSNIQAIIYVTGQTDLSAESETRLKEVVITIKDYNSKNGTYVGLRK